MAAQSVRSGAYNAPKAHDSDVEAAVGAVMERARRAQRAFAGASQERADDAVRALAWSIYKPEHARELAELAVADTGPVSYTHLTLPTN